MSAPPVECIRVQATELRYRTKDLIEVIKRGGTVIIRRYETDVARLVPFDATDGLPTRETPEQLLTERRFRRRVEERSAMGAAKPGPLWRKRDAS